MAFSALDELAPDDALHRIGSLIDLSHDLGLPEGTSRAIEWCDALEHRDLSYGTAALLEYYRSNAWANRAFEHRADMVHRWAWEQPELEHQLFHLRRAIRHPGFGSLDSVRQCQILTNLANQMNTLGRFAEAFEYWNRALAKNPRFAMALGNRALGASSVARALYDPGHRLQFLRFAYDELSKAVSARAYFESSDHADALAQFRNVRAQIRKSAPMRKIPRYGRLQTYSLGKSQVEKQYREWCLSQRLFLNPLNDLGTHSIAAQDVITLPNFTVPISETPVLIGFFNQMKQEFASARFLCFEGAQEGRAHFSDRNVLLLNTLDYPSYGLGVEKLKAAYRAAYSLFDKIGFFLNEYLALGIAPSNVSFRTIWYQSRKGAAPVLREKFADLKNWPLRGLFWLSKDLFEPGIRETTEPDAQALHEIRNHMEHRYLKVHLWTPTVPTDLPNGGLFKDTLAYSVTRADLEAKTLRVLRLARAGIIYLSLGMHAEERRRSESSDSPAMPMFLDTWEDDWKR